MHRLASSDFFGARVRSLPQTTRLLSSRASHIMSDFIMTLSSDDEGPAQAAPSKATSSSKKKASSTGKLTRKEQLAQKKGAKAQQKQKRKRFDDVSEDEEESAMGAPGSDEAEKMASDFVFDGLGGGFVGDRRNNVWVSLDLPRL